MKSDVPATAPRRGGARRRGGSRFGRPLLILGGVGLFAGVLAAAPLPGAPAAVPTPAAAAEEVSGDPYERETPHGCFFGFLRAAERGNYANAAEYLQIPPSLKSERETIARELQEVLDQRFFSTGLERISRSPRGSIDDGLPPESERVGEILGGGGEVLLVRREAAGGPAIWLISWETIREARQVYRELTGPEIESRLPAFFSGVRFGSLRLWQILGFVLLLPILYGLSWLLVSGLFAIVRLVRRMPAVESGEWTASARSPVTLLLTLLLHRIAVFWLGIPVMYRIYYNRFLYVVFFLLVLRLLLRLVDVIDRRLLRRVMPAGRTGGPSISLVRRALRTAAFVLVVLIALPAFGVNVTATLAGLGIGGLVLAFAAQKSLENVFGGFAILADRPLAVGDVCRIGGQLGEVEDITLWATRLRTHERTVVSIPNGAVMTGQIENLTRRDKFWFHPTVGLAYETTAAQMRQVVEGIRKLMAADPRVETDGSRACFQRLGASSLDIEIFGYVRADTYPEFLAIQEELLLRILEIVEGAGASVAFPTQTVHLRAADETSSLPKGRPPA